MAEGERRGDLRVEAVGPPEGLCDVNSLVGAVSRSRVDYQSINQSINQSIHFIPDKMHP